MAAWTYLVADLRTNVIIDELPLAGVRISKVLNGSGQLRGQLTLGDVKLAARNVYDLTRPARRVIYAVRDDRPWWGGIIWTSDYDSDTRVVDIGCADFWSYFDHRKVLEVLPAAPLAVSYVAGLSKVYTQQDQNAIARDLVTLAQSHTAGNIGIVVDTATSGILRDRTYEGFDLKDTGEALRDLTAIIDGPDIVFDVGAFDTAGRPTRLMRTGTPQLGQQGSAHRWDLGGNLLSYRWSSSGGLMATRTFAEGDGNDRGTIIADAEDTAKYATGWPLLETDDVFTGVTVPATLQQHADTLLAGLKLPVVGIELRIRGDLPPQLGEFSVGDDAQVIIPAGDLLFTAGTSVPVRMQAVDVTVDEEGAEAIAVTCRSIQEVA